MEIKKHYASFSEAIRAGAMLRPQVFGRLFAEGGSCSIGAGIEAMGLEAGLPSGCYGLSADSPNYIALTQTYPHLLHEISKCPTGHQLPGDFAQNIYGMIVHLNDIHEWSRERVADWLQDVEDDLLGYVTLENVPETQVTRDSREHLATPLQAGV